MRRDELALPIAPPSAGPAHQVAHRPVPAGGVGAPLITLRDAGVRFGDVAALAGVSLTLQRGEQIALVGANGAGKTTLLRLLHGTLPSSAGPGSRIEHQPDGRAPVAAMMFQRPFLLHLSAARNVRLALWLHGVPRAERAARTMRALERVGLAGLAARPARTLSGGEQQRLALARAWALEPDILFLDEPTASLDPSARREVEQLVAALAADGVTTVMTTHNLGQAKRLARRVLYLDHGRLRLDLPTERFFDPQRPPPEAAEFLRGELPWN
ncbi:MAG TPA: phosphate ABC transporter ATP-binding protein [Rubrivivax sp.]|jgi:tungstate transport system ATP-binding protein|nr:phosphate ABC transporter ATP-binding protein [Rhodoferax sp.]MCL4739222.1 phosphate ABC transporter ATP-binding protein [Burkholderiaceae bacterium]MCP5290056.1 phosphate ABC transporter ATP-binding protein [Burkholderiaceae bacterium]HMR68951.1 phosphate ABC transporter ATP-binding protein [Rubrivivax sp.]